MLLLYGESGAEMPFKIKKGYGGRNLGSFLGKNAEDVMSK